MNPRLQRLKKPALIFVGIIVLLLAFAWLILPSIVKSRAEQFIAERTGHKLSLAPPEINPLALSVRLRDLKLDDPEGQPLLGFRELFIDISAASLTERALVFDEILLDGLDARVIQQKEGLNWSPLLAALKGKEEPPTAALTEPAAPPPPRIDIHHLQIKGAQIEVADPRTSPPFATHIEPLDIELREVSTLPNDQGHFTLAATTAFGAQIDWQGDVTLNPLASSGQLSLQKIDLARLAPLLKGKLPIQPPGGVAGLSARYQFSLEGGKPELVLDQIALQLKNLNLQTVAGEDKPRLTIGAIELKDGRFELATQQLALKQLAIHGSHLEGAPGKALATLDAITLANLKLDLTRQQASLEAIRLQGGQITVQRDADGKLDLLAAIEGLTPPPSPETSKPWRFSIGQLGLAGLGVDFHDAGQAITLGLEHIAVELTGISEKLATPLPLKASLDVKSGGRLELAGKVVPADAAVELQLKLADLAIKPVQPIVSRFAALDLVSGKLSVDGRVMHNAKGSSYKGGFGVQDLQLNEAGTQAKFLGWKLLGSKDVVASAERLDIGTLALDGLDTKILIAKDKTTNLDRILRKPQTATTEATPRTVPEPATQKAGYPVNIDRLRFRNGELEFADQSLILRFGTRIHRLRGSVSGLSNQPGAMGELELDGEVDEFGLARAVGQVNLFNPTDFMDLKVVFRNVEMNGLTPYSATFAGRKIESGKLSLDLEYKIKQRQLLGENQLVIERLELGERIESPTAKDLPLDLAIALLRDSDGRIDLGLPISGNLDDPQFSYGQIIWKAVTNVLSKIVTAPFRALGSLLGGSTEKAGKVAFEPGAARLTPPEREKLVQLAAVLNKRPGLALSLNGTWAEVDRVALQERQLRRTIAAKAGLDTGEKGDPGPLSTRAPKVQSALDGLFAERFGSTELAALKEGFRRANPGQMEESTGGKMMSRLTGLMREKRNLSESEVEQLAGADFYAVLFQRLRAKEDVKDDALQTLATRRADSALEALKAAGAPEARVRSGAAEKTESEGREILLKLDLGKAGN